MLKNTFGNRTINTSFNIYKNIIMFTFVIVNCYIYECMYIRTYIEEQIARPTIILRYVNIKRDIDQRTAQHHSKANAWM